jgi:hypothetical protein
VAEKLKILTEKVKRIETEVKEINKIYDELERESDKIAEEYGFKKVETLRRVATYWDFRKEFESYNKVTYMKKPKVVELYFDARRETPISLEASLVLEVPKKGEFWTSITYEVKDLESLRDVFRRIDERLELDIFEKNFRGLRIPNLQKEQVVPFLQSLIRHAPPYQ